MQRIFKCCGIQNIILTPGKELNILIYRTPSHVIIWKSYTLLKMVQFFWPTLYFSATSKMHDSSWWWSWDAAPNKTAFLSALSRCRFAMHQSLTYYLRAVLLRLVDTVLVRLCAWTACVSPRKKTFKNYWTEIDAACYKYVTVNPGSDHILKIIKKNNSTLVYSMH